MLGKEAVASDAEETEKPEIPETPEFLIIRDMLNDKKVYETSMEELTKVLTDVLSLGSFTKTFSLYNGKLELTYRTLSEGERVSSFEYVRKYVDKHKDNYSQGQLDAFRAKVNISLQLVRIKTNGSVANIAEGSLDDRMALLSETPEDVVRVYSKYLMIFANLTSRAFNSEEAIKN